MRQRARRARHDAGVGIEQPDQIRRSFLRQGKVDTLVVARPEAAIHRRADDARPVPVLLQEGGLYRVGRSVAGIVVDHEGPQLQPFSRFGRQAFQARDDQLRRPVVHDDHVDGVERRVVAHSAATPMRSWASGSKEASAASSASWNKGARRST